MTIPSEICEFNQLRPGKAYMQSRVFSKPLILCSRELASAKLRREHW